MASADAVLSLLRPTHGRELTVRGLVELLDGRRCRSPRGSSTTPAGRSAASLADLCNVLSPSGVIVGGDLGVAAERRS